MSPFDLPIHGHPWEDLEVAASASMDYSEPAPSASMESIITFGNNAPMESYLARPVSPNVESVRLGDSMSPEYAVTSDINDDNSISSPGSQYSEDILEDLLINLKPTDGKYRCVDVKAEDHTCDYAAERKCMLR
jgi:hypothetical protein